MLRRLIGTSLLLIIGSVPATAKDSDASTLRRLLNPSQKVTPPSQELPNKAKTQLGRTLYFDSRLSADNSSSCNSCHDLNDYGTNGSNPRLDELNRDTPSIYNLKPLELFDWDGAITSLTEKIEDAIHSPEEMQNTNTEEMLRKFSGIKAYQTLFEEAYGKGDQSISLENTVDALEAFISRLTTKAPIDQFMSGEDDALTIEQIRGGYVFIEQACNACHTGPNFGGQMIQKMGVVRPWPNQRDLGYYEVSENSAHKMFFRVSPLRNVAETAPYFHDSSSKNLQSAIHRMALYERGHSLNTEDATAIEAFLKSLTGTLPDEHIHKPTRMHEREP